MRRGHIRVTSGSCLQGALVIEKCFGFIRNYSISFAEAAAVGIYTSSTPAAAEAATTTTTTNNNNNNNNNNSNNNNNKSTHAAL